MSGLALGCDTVAHKACLARAGKTIAVLAHGLDVIYPKENIYLAEEILDKGGLLLSEHPVGVLPEANHYIQRNRLQSGLSNAVAVIEMELESGTMFTVQFAELQKRMIGCINHPLEHQIHPKANGNQMLLATKRAYPLGTVDEIEYFIELIKG